MENSLYVKYFEDMIEQIKFYNISANQLQNYYSRLNYAINNGYVKRPLRYILSLFNSRVQPIITKTDKEIFAFVKIGLYDLLSQILKDANNKKILDAFYENELDKMEQIISLNHISYNMFVEYYNLVKIAFDISTNSINIAKMIRLLLNANVDVMTSIEYEQVKSLKAELRKKYIFLQCDEYDQPKRI